MALHYLNQSCVNNVNETNTLHNLVEVRHYSNKKSIFKNDNHSYVFNTHPYSTLNLSQTQLVMIFRSISVLESVFGLRWHLLYNDFKDYLYCVRRFQLNQASSCLSWVRIGRIFFSI